MIQIFGYPSANYSLQNILHLYKILGKFGKIASTLCSFCMKETETLTHLFHTCTRTRFTWSQLMESFHSGVLVTPTTPQNGIFEYNDLKLPTKEQLKFSR